MSDVIAERDRLRSDLLDAVEYGDELRERAICAEAERDALAAELAQAVAILLGIQDEFPLEIVRAFLARHTGDREVTS